MNIQNNILPLKPSSDFVLENPLCLFIGDRVYERSSSNIDLLVEELKNLDFLCVSYYNEEHDYYRFTTRNFSFNAQIKDEHNNFQITSISDTRETQAKKKFHYNRSSFIIFLKKGITIIYNDGDDYHCVNRFDSTDWDMSSADLVLIKNSVQEYFSYKEENTDVFVSNRFKDQIIEPIKAFTVYEDLAEKQRVYSNNQFYYDTCRFDGSNNGEKVYIFESTTFDPENDTFAVDSNVSVDINEQTAEGQNRSIPAIIIDRQITDNGVELVLKFRGQFDDSIIPKNNGTINPQINETQKRVRQRVINGIYNQSVDSKYMYSFFKTYTSEGFNKASDWNAFEAELRKQKYPPNAGQMNAIKKGIETKDIHLVLGPPGTGKTTVIVNWVKYFVDHGMRVLISSQNNAAVDNVLERAGKNGKAHIIRIGDERKIQENCKQYSINAQIDKGVELYKEKIDKTFLNLNSSKNAISSTLQLYKTNIDNVVKFYNDKKALDLMTKKILDLFTELKSAKNDIDSFISECSSYQNEIARKNIFLFEIQNKSKLYQFIHRHETKFILKERDELIKQYKEQTQNYYALIDKYNEISDLIQTNLKNKKYNDIKKSIGEQAKELAHYKWDVKTHVPRLDIVVKKEIVFNYSIPKLDSIRKNIVTLEATLKNISKIESVFNEWSSALDKKTTDIVSDLLIRNSNVVGATCIGINTRRKFADIDFDVSIIDESGQIQIHNAIVPMTRAPKTLMLGDHLQIPPMASDDVLALCKSDGVRTDLLEMSFFEYLFTQVEKTAQRKNMEPECITRLVEQFRMPANISDVISHQFYEDQYKAVYNMNDWKPIVPGTSKPLIMISTSGLKNRFETTKLTADDSTMGYCNKCEAEIVAKIISSIFKNNNDLNSDEIGIISAYGKQVRAIRKYIADEKVGFSNQQIYSMAASLDSFQGQERDLIIFSSTRSANKPPQNARIGFLKELRRLNVAFTRCKKQLVIIGDFDYLTTCEYEEISELGTPVPHKSEKNFAKFMAEMVEQSKSPAGEFYTAEEFCRKVGIEI